MNSDDPRHGTVNGYSNLKCRCADCRSAWADYMWLRRRERHAKGVPADIHGKYTTYYNYMCRCDECKRAHVAYRKTQPYYVARRQGKVQA